MCIVAVSEAFPAGEAWVSGFEVALPVEVDGDDEDAIDDELEEGDDVDGVWFLLC